MTNKILEKLKSAKTKEEASAMIQEHSPEDLKSVSGGAADGGSGRATIYWMLEEGLIDAAWNYLQDCYGITDSQKERYVKTYGYEGGIRYVVDKVLHLQ